MHARRLAVVADVQDLPDVLEGEPGGLGVPDEREGLQDGRVVVAVAGRGPGRGGEEVLVFPQNRIVLAGTPDRSAASPIFMLCP